MSKKFTRRKIVSSLGISSLGVIGLNQLSRPSLAASTDWTGNNVSQEVSNGTISDVTIPQSNLSFKVAHRGLDVSYPLSVQIEARLETEESTGSNEFDEIGAGSVSLNSADGTVTESDLTLDGYSFPLKIVSNHLHIEPSDFAVENSNSKTTTVDIQVIFKQGNATESTITTFDVIVSKPTSFVNGTYTGTVVSVQSENQDPIDVKFNNTGSKMFVLGYYQYSNEIYQYSLDTEFDITTATYDNVFLDIEPEDDQPKGFTFNSTGSKLLYTGSETNRVHEYSLTTNFDLDSTSYTGETYLQSGEVSLEFNSTGSKVYASDYDASNGWIEEYSLDTADDISTANLTNTLDVTSETDRPWGISVHSDGSKLYVIGRDNSELYEYSLNTPFDISTANYNGSLSLEDRFASGCDFNSDYSRLYIAGQDDSSIREYSP